MAEYRCWIPSWEEDRDDAEIVHAANAWHAAKIFAAKVDSASGGEVSSGLLNWTGDQTLVIHVLSDDGIETKWNCQPEAEIRWYARAAGVVSDGAGTLNPRGEGDSNG